MLVFSNLSEKEIVQLVKAGDQKAFGYLFDQHYSSLVIRAVRLLKNQTLSEDIVQEVFIKLWNKLQDNELTVDRSVEAYLWVMVRNKALDQLRKKTFHLQVDEGNESYDTDLLELAELKDRINYIVDSLPEKCRQVFVLSRFEDMTYKEIAEQLNISPKTVENQISKALKKLRGGLKNFFSILF